MPRPRDAPVFFIDHCLGTEKVAQRLRQAGVEAHVLVEAGFSADSDDVEWLPVVAARGWAVLTKDKRIRRRAIERQAIHESGAGAFILAASGLGGDAIAEALAQALPRMIKIWNTRARPFIATVNARGVVTLIEGGARLAAVKRD
jgi:PIN like domain